jgi:hypothetical protein
MQPLIVQLEFHTIAELGEWLLGFCTGFGLP